MQPIKSFTTMATAIHVPRINNNDDEVKLAALAVSVGQYVTKGQVLAQVETDKAVVEVEAGSDGFVLAIQGDLDARLQVGHVLMWLGQDMDVKVPERDDALAQGAALGSAPTAKARAMLQEHGLDPANIPSSGGRLTVGDVERFLATRGEPRGFAGSAPAAEVLLPDQPGDLKPLKSEERGMLSTVLWHRDVAVPGYVEITYDTALWDTYAQAFGKRHGLMLNPVLPLMAWRLVELARHNPRLNATIVGTQRYEYTDVHLGSTVQVGDVLYLAVVRNSSQLGALGFVTAMVDLQRRAASHTLGPQETQGTTLGFSSMARWKVARHIPILSPHTALMVAHTIGSDGVGVLGATYDHRVMGGSDVASALKKLTKPAECA
jgi:pyruvate/2-oxoglutarate dehydrogenase complex dihydrolipoamide acyltransferase (E2) component